MGTFIARMIMKESEKSIERGKEKYKVYFIKTSLYRKWKKEVDNLLKNEGYQKVIINE